MYKSFSLKFVSFQIICSFISKKILRENIRVVIKKMNKKFYVIQNRVHTEWHFEIFEVRNTERKSSKMARKEQSIRHSSNSNFRFDFLKSTVNPFRNKSFFWNRCELRSSHFVGIFRNGLTHDFK